MREKDLISFFTKGLKPKNKYELNKDKPQTLTDAYRMASAFEDCFKKKSHEGNVSSNFSKSGHRKNFQKHFRSKNFQNNNNYNRNKSKTKERCS